MKNDVLKRNYMNWLEQITKGLLNEITTGEAYRKFYNSIPKDIYDSIVGSFEDLAPVHKMLLDTLKNDNDDDTKYIVLYAAVGFNRLSPEARQAINGKVKKGEYKDDANNYRKQINDLISDISYFKNGGIASIKKFTEQGCHTIAIENDWIITCTTNYAANNHYFGKSHWCTASDRDGEYDGFRYFKNYTGNGSILIQFTSQKNVLSEEDSELIGRKYPSKIESETNSIRFRYQSIQVQTNGEEILQACDFLDRSLRRHELDDIIGKDLVENIIYNRELVKKYSNIREEQREPEERYQEKYGNSDEKIEKKRAVFGEKKAKAEQALAEKNISAKKEALERYNKFIENGDFDEEIIDVIINGDSSFVSVLRRLDDRNATGYEIFIFGHKTPIYSIREVTDNKGPYDIRILKSAISYYDESLPLTCVGVPRKGGKKPFKFEIRPNANGIAPHVSTVRYIYAGSKEDYIYLINQDIGNEMIFFGGPLTDPVSIEVGEYFDTLKDTDRVLNGFGFLVFHTDDGNIFFEDGKLFMPKNKTRTLRGGDGRIRLFLYKDKKGLKFDIYDYKDSTVSSYDLSESFAEAERLTGTEFGDEKLLEDEPLRMHRDPFCKVADEFYTYSERGNELFNYVMRTDTNNFVFPFFSPHTSYSNGLISTVVNSKCISFNGSEYFIVKNDEKIPCDKYGNTSQWHSHEEIEQMRQMWKDREEQKRRERMTPEYLQQMDDMWADRYGYGKGAEDTFRDWNDDDRGLDAYGVSVNKLGGFGKGLQSFDDDERWRGMVGAKDPEGYNKSVSRALNQAIGNSDVMKGLMSGQNIPSYVRRNPFYRIGKDGKPIDQPWYDEDEVPAKLSDDYDDDELYEQVNNLHSLMNRMKLF